MFKSFFPSPRLFFLSAAVYAALSLGVWYFVGDGLARWLGATPADSEVIGLGHFLTPQFLSVVVYYFLCCALFAAAWFILAPHPWQWWSIGGSMVLIFTSYFSVQVSVAINNWRRPFFDAVQNALSGNSTTTPEQLYGLIVAFSAIAFVWMAVYVITRFLVSHYIFRWRTAMNDFYMSHWKTVRHVEGAAQRVQEDTMRFATIMEDLGLSVIESVMTLMAFLPVLYVLSAHVTQMPLVGAIPAPLLIAAIVWSAFGTGLLALAGIKLPGLNFRNQRVEAAYRKELVYGEDHADRAQPEAVRGLFGAVRTNYFRMYFHYAYFNVFRGMYLQADNIFAYVILIPTIAAGKISFGILQQILTAFSQVSSSFQYLVNSWTTIIELLSIRKRLVAFEASLEGGELASIERENDDGGGVPPPEPPPPASTVSAPL
ncbi:MAG: peptide antibiotic transporter SbmA [Hyphomicrobiaceae bacterium]